MVLVWMSQWCWCVGTSVGRLANLAAVSQWYQCGGPGDPSREIPVLSVVRTCPLKVRVTEGQIRVKGLLMIGVFKYVCVGFILEAVLVIIIYSNIAT